MSGVIARVLAVGVVLIVGGEALCVLGPREGPSERIVHVACHALLYGGMLLAAAGAFLEGRRRWLRR